MAVPAEIKSTRQKPSHLSAVFSTEEGKPEPPSCWVVQGCMGEHIAFSLYDGHVCNFGMISA